MAVDQLSDRDVETGARARSAAAPDPIQRAIGIARIVAGASAVATPGLWARLWMGIDTPGARLAVRSMGARDVMIGWGAVRAVRRGEPATNWFIAGVGADVLDAYSTVRYYPSLPKGGRELRMAAVAGYLASNIWALRRAP